MNANWHNVTRREPCPICHKPDWCSLSNDGRVCVCRRIESNRPTKSGMGWIHWLRDFPQIFTTSHRQPTTSHQPSPDFAALHATFDGSLSTQTALAKKLGLSPESFAALDVRHNRAKNCMSFPMRDAEGHITGLRYRDIHTGRKLSARGSKDGLFFDCRPHDAAAEAEEIIITEGPTDTAAALDLGLYAVGRSSCLSGVQLLRDFIHLHRIRRVTIFADGDKPGRDGAKRLSAALSVPSRIMLPPPSIKDLREWSHVNLTKPIFDAAQSVAKWSLRGLPVR